MFSLMFILFCTISGSIEDEMDLDEFSLKNIEINVIPDTDFVSIKFSCTKCLRLQPPPLIQANLSCSTEWCKKHTDCLNLANEELTLDNISSFTKYQIDFRLCQSCTNCTNVIETKEFVTKPGAPKQIKEITVYSKNETSISLKVKPPHPPTGKLEVYRVSCKPGSMGNFDTKEIQKEFSVRPCDLWPDYHCLTILNLAYGQTYNVYLQSRNENSSFFSQNSKTISVLTRKEPSEAPHDLVFQWTNKYLNLKWKHPNRTNGDLVCFNITLISNHDHKKEYKKRFVKAVDEYKLEYSFEIDINEFLKRSYYAVRISAYNGYNGEELVGNILSFLPKPSEDKPQNSVNFNFMWLTIFCLVLLLTMSVSFLTLLMLKNSSHKVVTNNNRLSYTKRNIDPENKQKEALLINTKMRNSETLDGYLIPLEPTINQMLQENIKDEEEIFSKPIKVQKFREYVEISLRNGHLEHDFEMFTENCVKPVYETLDQLCEYIKFELVDGTKIPKTYVATQVPKANDVPDFWKQIWEDDIEFLVFLGEVGDKNFQYQYQPYWPEKGETIVCHEISVQQVYNKSFPFYVVRKFVLVNDELIKQVEQIHCFYFGFNPRKFVPFFRKMLRLPIKTTSSILVHSSVGIGGVGFVLLCDISLRLCKKEKTVNVMKNMHLLRKYKSGFIRNVEQYQLVHLVISHILYDSINNFETLNDYSNY